MGELTESANDVDFVSRQEQDAFAARSHQRAAAAIAAGVFKPEIEPVTDQDPTAARSLSTPTKAYARASP